MVRETYYYYEVIEVHIIVGKSAILYIELNVLQIFYFCCYM